jgi:ABC-type transport system involved in cytochrome bd biosynthesis fused ATPase/permease subunit
MEIFTIRHLTFSYPEQTKKALFDLSFSVGHGEFIALAGLPAAENPRSCVS